jgi:hypothetical protein
MLSLATAYIILRPFFRPKAGANGSLAFDDWEPDTESPSFPGSMMGKTQELNEKTHPHLRLDKIMISVPKLEPGDQIYCSFVIVLKAINFLMGSHLKIGHCDGVHAVEALHGGDSDSSVLYIPAVPLTIKK